MALKGAWVKWACIGVIIFLMAIAPLGYYAAFPFSVTVSLAAFFILMKDPRELLWKSGKGHQKGFSAFRATLHGE